MRAFFYETKSKMSPGITSGLLPNVAPTEVQQELRPLSFVKFVNGGRVFKKTPQILRFSGKRYQLPRY